jgi:arsenate reductase (thioredoxin)
MERLHWSFPDPAAVEGTEEQRKAAFKKIRDQIHGRITVFLGEIASAPDETMKA